MPTPKTDGDRSSRRNLIIPFVMKKTIVLNFIVLLLSLIVLASCEFPFTITIEYDPHSTESFDSAKVNTDVPVSDDALGSTTTDTSVVDDFNTDVPINTDETEPSGTLEQGGPNTESGWGTVTAPNNDNSNGEAGLEQGGANTNGGWGQIITP